MSQYFLDMHYRPDRSHRTRVCWASACRRAPVCTALAFFAFSVPAQIYVSAEAESGGSVVISNFATAETPLLLLGSLHTSDLPASNPLPVVPRRPSAPSLTLVSNAPIRALIDSVAAEVRISPQLLHAIIAVESNFNPAVVSPKGAIGLMQLMPETARRFGALDPFAPRQNIRAGAMYLNWLAGLFKDDLELVLAAYNAGEWSVIQAGLKIPPFAETQAYVPRVLAYLRCGRGRACPPFDPGVSLRMKE